MTESDEWGRDPAVRAMRRIFQSLEEAQRALWSYLSLSPFDSRIGRWRDQAKDAFERSFGRMVRQGGAVSENEASVLYLTGLGEALERDGIRVPPDILAGIAGKKGD